MFLNFYMPRSLSCMFQILMCKETLSSIQTHQGHSSAIFKILKSKSRKNELTVKTFGKIVNNEENLKEFYVKFVSYLSYKKLIDIYFYLIGTSYTKYSLKLSY